MVRADRRHPLGVPGVPTAPGAPVCRAVPQSGRLAAAWVLALQLLATGSPVAAQQGHAPAGSPSDVRYTVPTPGDARLHPRAPGLDAQPPTLFQGQRGGVAYAANAAVQRVQVEVDRDTVPADGRAPVTLRVRLYGAGEQLLQQPVWVTVEHSGGRILLPGARTDEAGPRGLDADRATPGVQFKVEGGEARFTLLAPAEAQDVRVRITAGAHEAAGTISFVPDQRPMIAAGLVEGIISFRNRGSLVMPRRGDGFEQEIQRWAREFSGGKGGVAGRAAFYLKGLVRGDVVLTAAYDSDKATRARLLRDVQPDQLYPVFGDASLRSFDARSGDRLYVRLDKGKSYALYGDFVTGDGFTQPIGQGAVASLKQRSLGNVNRTGTGARLHHEKGGFTGNVYATHDTLRQVVEEIISQGSGPYGLRHNGVLEGSEKVEVLVRDRNQPSRILSVRPLVRLVDYSFEPFSGRILLASFLPSVDEQLNPVSLRISYEVDQGGDAFWLAGVDGQWRAGERVEIGGSALTDRNPLAPYQLLSANATVRLAERSALVIEAAQSSSTVNTNPANGNSSLALAGRSGRLRGDALRAELAHEGERTQARLFYGRSSPLFNNPAAPLNGGREELYARGAWRLAHGAEGAVQDGNPGAPPDGLQLYAEALRSEDRKPGGGERSQAGLGLRWTVNPRLTLDASLRTLRETIGSQPNGSLSGPFDQTLGLSSSIGSGSGGGALGFGNAVLDPATGLPVIQQGGLPPAASNLTAGTRLASDTVRLGAGWRVNERFTLGAEGEVDLSGQQRRRVALGGDLTLAERTRLYGRYELQDGWVQLAGVSDTGRRAGAFVLGVDSSWLADTQLFSEFRLRDAVAGRDLQLASGARHVWNVAEGWRVSAAAEHLRVISGATAPVNAVSAGLDWTAHPLWRASTRVELRQSGDVAATPGDERFQTTLLQALVARKLSRDWTLLARHHGLHTDYRARGDVRQDRAQLGLAYRETDTNRVNALAKIEFKHETDASNAAVGELKSRAWIMSTHADFHPRRPWWMTGRWAAKWQRDRFENGVPSSFAAQLLAGRIVYDIAERWDIGALAAVQWGRNGARQHAWGLEAGYLLQTNLWLSAGVNAAGFAGDADLTGYAYTRRGVYLRLRFKFDEGLFKGRDPVVNRSLPR